jgi:hypothetical protein
MENRGEKIAKHYFVMVDAGENELKNGYCGLGPDKA